MRRDLRPGRSGIILLLAAIGIYMPAALHADQTIELETTRIKANEELPQILYIVPWKDLEAAPARRFKLQLHDLFSDLYEPQLPAQAPGTNASSENADDHGAS